MCAYNTQSDTHMSHSIVPYVTCYAKSCPSKSNPVWALIKKYKLYCWGVSVRFGLWFSIDHMVGGGGGDSRQGIIHRITDMYGQTF